MVKIDDVTKTLVFFFPRDARQREIEAERDREREREREGERDEGGRNGKEAGRTGES